MQLRPNTAYPESDPRYHTANIKATLHGLIEHLRDDDGKVDAPKAQALFETAAEVLIGPHTAFDHYERGEDDAMREPAHSHDLALHNTSFGCHRHSCRNGPRGSGVPPRVLCLAPML